MVLTNKGEYLGEGTPADVISEISQRSKVGLVSALADRIDFSNDYILSFKEDTYERVTEKGDLMHGIKMMVSADPLVRCKECKFWKNKHLCATWSAFGTIETEADDFCSYGERSE